jgi:fatty acid desaturase
MTRAVLRSRHAAWITHLSLGALTIIYFTLLLRVPFWVAFPLGVLIAHRIGVLIHDYIHGIPLRAYRHNHAVVTFFDGLLLMFGTLEMFRATHLAHHRWLNTGLDPAREIADRQKAKRWRDTLAAPELIQYLAYFRKVFSGRTQYCRRDRILLAAALSLASIALWAVAGYPELVWKMLAVDVFTLLVPVSLRGAVEHHSYTGDSRFANEYRVRIPLFNINRHIHHHEDPALPWYLLEFRSERPLSPWNYFTAWYHVYIKRDFVLMRPMESRAPSPTGRGRPKAG